eukprot:15483619-Alexandrium_andersonii.AAC.1
MKATATMRRAWPVCAILSATSVGLVAAGRGCSSLRLEAFDAFTVATLCNVTPPPPLVFLPLLPPLLLPLPLVPPSASAFAAALLSRPLPLPPSPPLLFLQLPPSLLPRLRLCPNCCIRFGASAELLPQFAALPPLAALALAVAPPLWLSAALATRAAIIGHRGRSL